MTRILLLALVFAASLLLAGHAAAAATDASAPTLAGRAFAVDFKDPDGKSDKDSLVFTEATGDSTACHAFGFGTGPVTYSPAPKGVAFAFTTKSEKEGTMAWKGTAEGDKITGTAVWTKDGKTTNYTFAGSEQTRK